MKKLNYTFMLLFFCWCVMDFRIFLRSSQLLEWDERLREQKKHFTGLPLPCAVKTRAWPLPDYVYIGWAAEKTYEETGEFPCDAN